MLISLLSRLDWILSCLCCTFIDHLLGIVVDLSCFFFLSITGLDTSCLLSGHQSWFKLKLRFRLDLLLYWNGNRFNITATEHLFHLDLNSLLMFWATNSWYLWMYSDEGAGYSWLSGGKFLHKVSGTSPSSCLTSLLTRDIGNLGGLGGGPWILWARRGLSVPSQLSKQDIILIKCYWVVKVKNKS